MTTYRDIPANDLYLVDMASNAKKPLVANVKSGARVLIITDTRQDPLVWKVMAMAVQDLGGDPMVTVITPRPVDYYDPPQPVLEALKHADLGILLASTTMLHAPGCDEVMELGVPLIAMDGGMTRDMLTMGAATADYRMIQEINHLVAVGVFGEDPDEIRMTSDFGTDITCSIKGRMAIPKKPGDGYIPLRVQRWSGTEDYGSRKGASLYGFAFPGGEVNTAPIEDSGQGTLVIDTTMHNVGRIDHPIKLTIRDGRIVDIDGEYEADQLRDYLLLYGDDNSWYMPTEFAVGTNYAARVTGLQREDKNILGCVHVGLGTNKDIGGTLQAKLHMDGVILKPTVYVDGVRKIDRGHVLYLEECGMYDRLLKARQEQAARGAT